MTDNEIIKALECCSFWGKCNKCPYNGVEYKSNKDNCTYNSTQAALDLINRQKAEIEEQDQAIIGALKHMEKIRSEAIKEFAEMVCDGRLENDPVVIAVRCAVTEMAVGK